MSGEGKVVCVTGASGYIASWLFKLLLQNGYTVKATVRNIGEPSKVEHLKTLTGAKERLQLYQANLTEQGSFDAAFDGCHGVFHVASPVMFHNIHDPQVELVQPAVNGTLSVLGSCVKVPSIKRVVLTSSLATLMFNRNPKTSDTVIDETWYSDPAVCEEVKGWYCLSKTLAEEAARKFAEQHGIDLVVMNPGFVIGPCLQPTLNATFEDFLHLLREGESIGAPGGICLLVDVRDVARAHILAFENPSAAGRYCLVTGILYYFEVFNILRGFYPNLNLYESLGENQPRSPPYQVSKEKVKSLGINFFPLEESLKGTIELLKDKNLLSFNKICSYM